MKTPRLSAAARALSAVISLALLGLGAYLADASHLRSSMTCANQTCHLEESTVLTSVVREFPIAAVDRTTLGQGAVGRVQYARMSVQTQQGTYAVGFGSDGTIRAEIDRFDTYRAKPDGTYSFASEAGSAVTGVASGLPFLLLFLLGLGIVVRGRVPRSIARLRVRPTQAT